MAAFIRSLVFALLWGLSLSTITTFAHDTCDSEFEHCDSDADCCKSLSCVAKDGSHCLSERSAALNALTEDQKLHMLKDFFDHKAPPQKRKSTAEVHALLQKNRRMFAKLIKKIEKHYKLTLPMPGEKLDPKEEL